MQVLIHVDIDNMFLEGTRKAKMVECETLDQVAAIAWVMVGFSSDDAEDFTWDRLQDSDDLHVDIFEIKDDGEVSILL